MKSKSLFRAVGLSVLLWLPGCDSQIEPPSVDKSAVRATVTTDRPFYNAGDEAFVIIANVSETEPIVWDDCATVLQVAGDGFWVTRSTACQGGVARRIEIAPLEARVKRFYPEYGRRMRFILQLEDLEGDALPGEMRMSPEFEAGRPF